MLPVDKEGKGNGEASGPGVLALQDSTVAGCELGKHSDISLKRYEYY